MLASLWKGAAEAALKRAAVAVVRRKNFMAVV